MPSKVTLLPIDDNQFKAVSTLGTNGWEVLLEADKVQCLNGKPGVLIKKEAKTMWVKKIQVQEEK